MFGMYLGNTDQQSQLHVGGWDDKYVNMFYTDDERANKTASELIKWMDINSQSYWQVSLN